MTTLLAYDGRPSCKRALDYAIRYAVNFNEPLYILTVVSKDKMDPEDPDPTVREYMEAAQKKASAEGAIVHSAKRTRWFSTSPTVSTAKPSWSGGLTGRLWTGCSWAACRITLSRMPSAP